jgi:hypothetical protein
VFILSLSTQSMNITIDSSCWHIRDTFCFQECQVISLYKCLHQCLWYRCVVWSGNFRIVLFSFWYPYLHSIHAALIDIVFLWPYAVSPVIVLLLDTFAEVLCFELGMLNLQLFVNCDVIKSPHLQCHLEFDSCNDLGKKSGSVWSLFWRSWHILKWFCFCSSGSTWMSLWQSIVCLDIVKMFCYGLN